MMVEQTALQAATLLDLRPWDASFWQIKLQERKKRLCLLRCVGSWKNVVMFVFFTKRVNKGTWSRIYILIDIQNHPNTWWEGLKGTCKIQTSGDVNGDSNTSSKGVNLGYPHWSSWEKVWLEDSGSPWSKNNHLSCIKPFKYRDKLPIDWCRISEPSTVCHDPKAFDSRTVSVRDSSGDAARDDGRRWYAMLVDLFRVAGEAGWIAQGSLNGTHFCWGGGD